ncbi:RICIN domain-containing protein [Micromonospora sp. M12]
MFLDDAPPAAQRPAFEQYMRNGGAWMGFHVSAFTTNPSSWSWYYNTFLGTGSFQTNTWGPTGSRCAPTTAPTPPPAISRRRSLVDQRVVLLEQRPAAEPQHRHPGLGRPVQLPGRHRPQPVLVRGYYPLVWSNRQYKMLYANFGHNAMDYSTNTGLSSTFDSAQQNKLLIDGCTGSPGRHRPADHAPPTDGTISPTAWHTVVNRGNGKCVDARAAASANGTAIQQYACNSSSAQQYQFAPTSGGYLRVNNRNNSAQVLDVTDRSTADSAPIQLWSYSGGNNQQWRAESEGGGYYRLVNRSSGKCLDVPAASTADGVQLVQYTCNGTAAQSFRLVPQS